MKTTVNDSYPTQRGVTDLKPAIDAIRDPKNIRYQHLNNNLMGNDYRLLALVCLHYFVEGPKGALSYLSQTLTLGYGNP